MSINLWIVLLAAVVGMAIEVAWYSPVLFGRAWTRLAGLSAHHAEEMRKRGMGKNYLAGFIAEIVSAYVLGYLVLRLGAATFGDGFGVGFIVWLGFVATLLLGRIIWEGAPLKLFLINSAEALISMGIMAGILAKLL